MSDHNLCSVVYRWVNKYKYKNIEMQNGTINHLVKQNFRSKKLRPIGVESTTVNYEGWIQFNFTTVLSGWIVNKPPNNMLDITIECNTSNGNSSNRCELFAQFMSANNLLRLISKMIYQMGIRCHPSTRYK